MPVKQNERTKKKTAQLTFKEMHGTKIKDTHGNSYTNFSSFDVLGLQGNQSLIDNAKKVLREYGVGTCGPRGFYGTLDIHLKLEEEIAKFLGTEAAIIYSQAFSTVSSAIPAFAKRGDIIVADESVNVAVKTGIELSRSKIFYFKHNDMKNLQKTLEKIELLQAGKPLNRKFLITEGIFYQDCSICPLEELISLKRQYKYRLFVDETLSFGSLGSRGKGVSEHFGIPSKEIDLILGSLAHCIGAGGGFCAGSVQIVDHQRLSSQAYCFSASMPAILTSTAIQVIQQHLSKEKSLARLQKNIEIFNNAVSKKLCNFILIGDADSPFRYLVPLEKKQEHAKRICELATKSSMIITEAVGIIGKEGDQICCLRICLSAAYSEKDLKMLIELINKQC
jgi:serine palmitoyltransferase